jgi:hypothetical protein
MWLANNFLRKQLFSISKLTRALPLRNFGIRITHEDNRDAHKNHSTQGAFEFHVNRFTKSLDTNYQLPLTSNLRDVMGLRMGFIHSDQTYILWRNAVIQKLPDPELTDKDFCVSLHYLLALSPLDVELWSKALKFTERRFYGMSLQQQIQSTYYVTKNILYGEFPETQFSAHTMKALFGAVSEKNRYKRFKFDDLIKASYTLHTWGINVEVLLDYMVEAYTYSDLDKWMSNTNNNQ